MSQDILVNQKFNSVRKLLKDFRELYGYGSMGMCGSDDKITGPEAIA